MSKNLEQIGLKSIVSQYDLFFIDIWGVIHNGIKLHENAVKVLEELSKNNKKFILLTNAPRPNNTVISFLKNLGLDQSKCKKVSTSGEVALKYLKSKYKALKFFHVGPPRDFDLFKSFEEFKVNSLDESDFIICTGLYDNFSENLGFSPSQAWVCLAAWVSIFFTVLLLKRLSNSPWGRALRAVREDEDAVRAMGKNAVWLKLQSFMLGAGIAGLSGVLLAFNYGSLETTVFIPLLTFYVWAIMILGGVGSLTGPIFGSIIFWVIIGETNGIAQLIFENANGQQLAGVRFLLVGVLIMFLMIFRPSGLLGKKEELLLDVKSS